MTETTGAFVRRDAAFRETLEHAEAGRYHLYVALACPWSHRAVIVRRLKGLEDAVSMSLLHPYRDERGWRFTGGRFDDPVNDFQFLHQAYECTVPGYEDRVSVPVLWDKRDDRIVSNESADILRMFNAAFEDATGPDLYPPELRAEIDAINDLVYSEVNNGVYRAGFAESQDAYDEAFDRLFTALATLEERLGGSRYMVGDTLTEADWRLFPTLVRFDEVYHLHFRCNGRRLIDHPNLWGYARELYQRPGIADTVAMDEIKRHYYTTHDSLNPKHIIPRGPLDADWHAPHGRG